MDMEAFQPLQQDTGLKLRDFSDSLNGTIIGNPDLDITGVSGIADARTGDITFISSPKFLKYAAGTSASCIIVKDPIKDSSITQLQVDNPQYAFAKALEIFYPFPGFKPGTSPAASVAETASLGRDVHIAAFACISDQASIGDGSVILPGVFIGRNTTIGSRCMIYPNVVIGNNVRIGDRVIIHAGTVIGSDGFGYVLEKGLHYKIPQAGGVIIGDDVEIGSNVSIDRATLGNTKIGKGTKIDNLTQIAHNVTIGENSLIVSQVGIAGSSDIGSYVILGGQVGVADHTSVESGTMVAARSGLMGEVKKGIYGGAPAMPHKTWLRAHALFAKLPEMQKKIRELEEKIQALEKEANKE